MKIRNFRRNISRSQKLIPAKFLNWSIREVNLIPAKVFTNKITLVTLKSLSVVFSRNNPKVRIILRIQYSRIQAALSPINRQTPPSSLSEMKYIYQEYQRTRPKFCSKKAEMGCREHLSLKVENRELKVPRKKAENREI